MKHFVDSVLIQAFVVLFGGKVAEQTLMEKNSHPSLPSRNRVRERKE